MKNSVLVIIKPDGMRKGLIGAVLEKFGQANLEIIGFKLLVPKQKQVEEHYKHIQTQEFFKRTVTYFMGGSSKGEKLLALIYSGEDAIRTCRSIAGATNPEDADPHTIRGAYGRVTTKGVYENVVHVSSDKREAEREIKIWFEPEEILEDLYKVRLEVSSAKKKVWK